MACLIVLRDAVCFVVNDCVFAKTCVLLVCLLCDAVWFVVSAVCVVFV